MFAQRLFKILLFTTALTASNGAASTVAPIHREISPDIVHELKDFIKLIPESVLDELVAKHYIIDSNFREVLKYVRSSEFMALLQRVQQIPEVIEVLDFLHLLVEPAQVEAATHTADRNHYRATCQIPSPEMPQLEEEEQLDFVLLNNVDEVTFGRSTSAPQPSGPRIVPNVHTFSSFVEELVGHLPRDQYVQLINQKRQKIDAFAQFYAALRSTQLRPMVDTVLKSGNLAAVIKSLSSNGIDVNSLESTAFKVISWGPSL